MSDLPEGGYCPDCNTVFVQPHKCGGRLVISGRLSCELMFNVLSLHRVGAGGMFNDMVRLHFGNDAERLEQFLVQLDRLGLKIVKSDVSG